MGWEYKIERWTELTELADFNTLGKDRWELVAIHNNNAFIFKRWDVHVESVTVNL